MKINEDIEILPEDRIVLTNDQENMIILALRKQLPPEDAAFIKKIKENSTKNSSQELQVSFAELSGYYTTKYGVDFGMVYLAAITGGEEKYKETVKSIERMRSLKRMKAEN